MKTTNKISIKAILAMAIIMLTLSLGLVFLLGKNKEKDNKNGVEDVKNKGKYAVYYVNPDKDGMVTDYCNLISSTIQGKVDELKLIIEKNSLSGDYFSAKPSSLKVTKMVLADKVLNITFDSKYDELSKVEKLFVKAAYVLTFTQITGIDYVSFYVNDQPLTDGFSNVVGALSASNFVEFSVGNTAKNTSMQITMYLSNESGNKLKKVTKSCEYTKEESLEEFVLNQLFISDNSNLFPKGVHFDSVFTKDGICYVDFDDCINETIITAQNGMMLYSIVNTLSELSSVSKVQFSVGGNVNVTLNGLSLSSTYTRNLDINEY